MARTVACALPYILAVASVITRGSEAVSVLSPPDGAAAPMDDLAWDEGIGEISTYAERPAANSSWGYLPEALRGRRLVLIGDSNDRNLLQHLSRQRGTKENSVFQLSGGLKLSYLSTMFETNFESHDLIVNFVWHPGVMSIPPQPTWHAKELQRGGDQNRLRSIPHDVFGGSVVSSTQLVDAALKHFAYADKRPITAVVQSSLWDSILAKEARQVQAYRNATEAFESWDWLGRASELVMVVAKHVGLENMYWRTNANCPFMSPFKTPLDLLRDENAWVDSVSEKQAALVREAMRRRVPPWDKIGLIDWRQEYFATKCEGVHYPPEGYASLFKSLKHALVKSG